MPKFSNKSKQLLKGVHPNLIKVMERAIEITEQDFSIICGVRTLETQRNLVKQGKSKTMKSKHLVQVDGYSHAVDVVPYPIDWNLENFYPIAEAVRKASKELNINVRWGGAWITLNLTEKTIGELVKEYSEARRKSGNKVFIDAPHFELI